MAFRTPVVVATWAFAPDSVTVATTLASRDMLVEEDEKYGQFQVGRGGPANMEGEVELDAAIMSGSDLRFGAVTALQGVSRASSVARCVLEKSPHSMLSAQGAQDFALKCGFHLDIPHTGMPTGDGSCGTEEKRERADMVHGQVSHQHDTLGLIVLDVETHIAADDQVGAVCCSGEGDEIMKFCPSFLVMENMRQGMSPQSACQAAVRRIQQRIAPKPMFELAIIAVSIKGELGAASTVKEWTLLGKVPPSQAFLFWWGQ